MENATKFFYVELNCADGVPSFLQFIQAFDLTKSLIVLFAGIFSVSIILIYIRSFKSLMKNAPKIIKPNCISLISIYPIVSVCSMVAILVPRTYFFMDTIGHCSFMIISYQLFR